MDNLHLQSEAISKAKSDIIDKFFKNALWIDDSIIDDITQIELDSNIIQGHFDPFVKYVSHLADQGITCALKGYKPKEEYGDGLDVVEIEKCTNLAKKSDIVFLDWHLTDGGPQASLAIIDGIIQNPGFKIIIIITAHTNWHNDIRHSCNLKQEKDWLTNGKGTYITHIDKGVIQGRSSFDFWSEIKSKLLHITPNILSWIALGLSAEIKDFTPQWISSLPNGIEFATCIHQIILDNPSILSGELLINNLLEDLKHIITASNISIADNETFSLSNLRDFTDYYVKLKTSVKNLKCSNTSDTPTNEILESAKNTIDKIQDLERINKKAAIKFVKALIDISNTVDKVPIEVELLSNSCKLLNTFSENLNLIDYNSSIIQRGNVYADNNSKNKIYICISQECDCIRAKSLIFLQAKISKKHENNHIHVYFNKELYIIPLTGSSLIPVDIVEFEGSRKIKGNWKLEGRLRKSTVDKITHDFWQNSTRVGVDIPEFERSQRK